jgi:hypothetical protein
MTRQFTKEVLQDCIIGLDFDGTCVNNEFPFVGKDIGAVPVIKRLIKEFNVKIVLNTVRSEKYLEEAVKWCKDNDIPLYGINENPEQKKWSKSPKVHADLFIDDLGIGIPLTYSNDSEKPYVDWKEVEKMIFGEVKVKVKESQINEELKKLLDLTRMKMGM